MNSYSKPEKVEKCSQQQSTAQADSDSDYDDICSGTVTDVNAPMSQPAAGSAAVDDQFVTCPMRCGKIIETKWLERHTKDTCPMTVVDCDFNNIGCDVRLPRKDMPLHMEQAVIYHHTKQLNSYEERIKLLEADNKMLSARCERLEAQYEALILKVSDTFNLDKISTKLVNAEEGCKEGYVYQDLDDTSNTTRDDDYSYVSAIDPVNVSPFASLPLSTNSDIIMTNFQIHKKSNDFWVSQPFYTHSHGYKMCLRVTANGQGSGKGTHITVAVYLMKGEFDDQLEWPFRGDITIQLLNQLTRGGAHYTRTIYQAKGEKRRSCLNEKFVCAWGISKFKLHFELFPKYLQDDSLKFRISTLMKSNITLQKYMAGTDV